MRPRALSIASVLVLLAAGGCGGGSPPTATERLWISGVPASPKAPMTAFVTTRLKGEQYLGSFFKGSLYRGHHDVFEWIPGSKNQATLRFLQDGQTRKLKMETCKPTRGFDYCLLIHGDPTGTVRYLSRKRWAVRRPGRKRSDALVTTVLTELAAEDVELAAAIAQP